MIRFVVVLSLALISCTSGGVSDEEWVRRGNETLQPFKAKLQAALKEGLAKGPENAISVCSVRAPELALEAGSKNVLVGRASARYRNPENAPAPWIAPILEAYEANPGSAKSKVVRLDGGAVGYAEPIFVQPMCLTCHGETIPANVRTAIEEKYPDDKAMGFRNGDFRGAFWVEFRGE
ncbi:MAG: Tll0287-like domain-containing protein [Thermoanaerobaculia bacterium]